MNTICGVDGCRNGWIVIKKYIETGSVSWQLTPQAADFIIGYSLSGFVGIDIPIGLPEKGLRICDVEARKLLGPRAASIFPAPLRSILRAGSYEEACSIRLTIEGKKMSRQAWNILGKIREVDQLMLKNPGIQSKVREVHPELSFYLLADRKAMTHSKRVEEGKRERIQLLRKVYGNTVDKALSDRRSLGSNDDDILDAFAVLYTAERIARDEAFSLPANPPADSQGLKMEIVV